MRALAILFCACVRTAPPVLPAQTLPPAPPAPITSTEVPVQYTAPKPVDFAEFDELEDTSRPIDFVRQPTLKARRR